MGSPKGKAPKRTIWSPKGKAPKRTISASGRSGSLQNDYCINNMDLQVKNTISSGIRHFRRTKSKAMSIDAQNGIISYNLWRVLTFSHCKWFVIDHGCLLKHVNRKLIMSQLYHWPREMGMIIFYFLTFLLSLSKLPEVENAKVHATDMTKVSSQIKKYIYWHKKTIVALEISSGKL